MADDLDAYLKKLPDRLRRDMAATLEDVATDLSNAIRDAAPQGKTGNLKRSVRVTKGRHDLELFVDAGGDLTTKEVRKGSGEPSDYALHVEFGTLHAPAQPFFYPTYRAKASEIRKEIEDAVADALSKT